MAAHKSSLPFAETTVASALKKYGLCCETMSFLHSNRFSSDASKFNHSLYSILLTEPDSTPEKIPFDEILEFLDKPNQNSDDQITIIQTAFLVFEPAQAYSLCMDVLQDAIYETPKVSAAMKASVAVDPRLLKMFISDFEKNSAPRFCGIETSDSLSFSVDYYGGSTAASTKTIKAIGNSDYFAFLKIVMPLLAVSLKPLHPEAKTTSSP